MKERTLNKIYSLAREDNHSLEKKTKKLVTKTNINTSSEPIKINLPNENYCPHCQLKTTTKKEHKFLSKGSLCDDCKRDYWLTTGLSLDPLKKKEPINLTITEFLLYL